MTGLLHLARKPRVIERMAAGAEQRQHERIRLADGPLRLVQESRRDALPSDLESISSLDRQRRQSTRPGPDRTHDADNDRDDPQHDECVDDQCHYIHSGTSI